MDQLVSDQSLPRTSTPAKSRTTTLVTVLFFVFPPVGIYLLWKDRELHELFAILTVVVGILNSITALSLVLSYGSIIQFSVQNNFQLPSNLDKLALIYLFFSIYQTFSCLILVREARKTGYLNTTRLLYLVGLLFIDFVVVPLILGIIGLEFVRSYTDKWQMQFERNSFDTY